MEENVELTAPNSNFPARKWELILLIAMAVYGATFCGFCCYGIYDLNRITNQLANDPSASGIDYLGMGWGYSICLFFPSIVGLITSAICARKATHKHTKIFFCVSEVLYILLLIVSVFLFYW